MVERVKPVPEPPPATKQTEDESGHPMTGIFAVDQTGSNSVKKQKRHHSSMSARSEQREGDDAVLHSRDTTNRMPKTAGQERERNVSSKTNDVAEGLPIPRTIAAFSEADKMMWNMRKAGKGWEEIRVEWERMTGQRVAGTTLPNRFVRIKENIGDFNEDDDEMLLRCKQELEKTFSDELWSMISEAMTSKGGNKFSAAAIQKRFKQLCEDVNTAN